MKLYEIPEGMLFSLNAGNHSVLYRMKKYEGTHAQCEDEMGKQYTFIGTLTVKAWPKSELDNLYYRRMMNEASQRAS